MIKSKNIAEEKAIDKKRIEVYFSYQISNSFNQNSSYLRMPNNNSFKYCLKEILYTLKQAIDTNQNNIYSDKLIKNFYHFMSSDVIFKEVNELQYKSLMLRLKDYTENPQQKKQQYAFFELIDKRYSQDYFNLLVEKIKESYMKPVNDWGHYDRLFSLFINELLANGLSLQYLLYINRSKNFKSFIHLIDFLAKGNLETYDIWLPLKNCNEKTIEFLKANEQVIEKKIISGKETICCKVYENYTIDFVNVIRFHQLRIESMLNILRIYTKTDVDFAYAENALIGSKYFEIEEEIPFESILKYKGNIPYSKHLNNLIKNLNALCDYDKNSYHKLLNIISYTERDKDFVNTSSFVDNWIALESMCSLSGIKQGYEAVLLYVDKIISSKIVCKDLTNLLIGAYKKYHKQLNIEGFVDFIYDKNFETEMNKIPNDYYRFHLKKYAVILKEPKKLREFFDEIERQFEVDLLRIYMLRNEYVHESNLSAFHSLQHYKIKNILSLLIDEFFKQLHQRISKKDVSIYGITFEIFNHFTNKHTNKVVALRVLTEDLYVAKKKINLTVDYKNIKVGYNTFVVNLLLNNTDLFKKYISKEDYELEENLEEILYTFEDVLD